MFKYFFKKGCGACETIKEKTLKKFVEGVDYEAIEISSDADWDEYDLMAVPAFRWTTEDGREVLHYGLIGPIQLKRKLNELH